MKDEWLDRLHYRFAQMYRQKFTSEFKEEDQIEEWKKSIGQAVGSFGVDAIKAALDDMLDTFPSWPPTPAEFRSLCKSKVKPEYFKALPAPAAIGEDRREEISAAIARVAAPRNDGRDYKLWAKKLRTRYLAGERLIEVQISLASEALHEVWEAGQCKSAVRAAA